jgi:hypothetical protein
MALNDAQFIADVVAIQDQVRTATDYDQSKEQYAQLLLNAIKTYLQSGTVTITGTSNAGAFTGTGTIT